MKIVPPQYDSRERAIIEEKKSDNNHKNNNNANVQMCLIVHCDCEHSHLFEFD